MSQSVSAINRSIGEAEMGATDLPLIPHLILGERQPGETSRRGLVFNPSLGVAIAEVPLAGPAEVDQVVAVARGSAPLGSLQPDPSDPGPLRIPRAVGEPAGGAGGPNH